MIPKVFKYLVLALITVIIVISFNYYREVNFSFKADSQKAQFTITRGESVKDITDNLFNQGLIRSKLFFKVYVWNKKDGSKLQAGTYDLKAGISIKEITKILISGSVISEEREITIIPGWNLLDIADYLANQGLVDKDDFLKITGKTEDFSSQYSFLTDKPKNYGLEGYIFPDTYRIYKNATPEAIVLKALDNFDSKLTPELRQEIKRQGKTIYEVMTMASIVEKEVRSENDMKIVAGIFWNRIKIGQPLQSCATLAYVLGENKAVYSLADTKVNSLYNTYQHRGLPPGPIASPSLKAIEATIYPEETTYNYFLSRPDTGETIFSKTLAEHNLNKEKYLK